MANGEDKRTKLIVRGVVVVVLFYLVFLAIEPLWR
jgi:hypothetical protein